MKIHPTICAKSPAYPRRRGCARVFCRGRRSGLSPQQRVRATVGLLLFFLLESYAQAATVTVAAASDLNFAIKEIIVNFEKATGNHVQLTLGSSGNFYAQISNGAPFEVFLSADAAYPENLKKAGKVDNTFIYAVGKIVLWVPNTSKVDIYRMQMKSLLDPSIRKIAIANPVHAPYGKAAVAAMRSAGVYDSVQSRLVLGENISQTAQFMQSGATDIGIVALSLALSESMRVSGRYWEIPQNLYPRMEQAAALMKDAGPAARSFYEWLRRPESRQILTRYGFGLP
jgi:molybdate transport system substrate-binding protein